MIKLNEILGLSKEDIKKTYICFMTPNDSVNFNPLENAKDKEKSDKLNLVDLVYNPKTGIYFDKGTIAIGFIRYGSSSNKWLMTGIVDVKKHNGYAKSAEAKYRDKKFNYRLVVKYHKKGRNNRRKANEIIDELEVLEIWDPNKNLNNTEFPGYQSVKVNYNELKNKLENSIEWINALKLRKGVYLITDMKNGKLYVGSAYGKDGIYGRWKVYMKSGYDKNEKENGKYPNKKLRELVLKKHMEYIKSYFQYSILETFVDDKTDDEIIKRESWWKEILLSRQFGYNAN